MSLGSHGFATKLKHTETGEKTSTQKRHWGYWPKKVGIPMNLFGEWNLWCELVEVACRISGKHVTFLKVTLEGMLKPGRRSLEHPSEKSLKRSAAASSQPSGKQSWEIAKVDCQSLRSIRIIPSKGQKLGPSLALDDMDLRWRHVYLCCYMAWSSLYLGLRCSWAVGDWQPSGGGVSEAFSGRFGLC